MSVAQRINMNEGRRDSEGGRQAELSAEADHASKDLIAISQQSYSGREHASNLDSGTGTGTGTVEGVLYGKGVAGVWKLEPTWKAKGAYGFSLYPDSA